MSRDGDRFEAIRKFLRPGEEPTRRVRYVQVKKARGDFVLTSQRILFIQRNLLGTVVEEIPLDRVDSVSHRTGLVMGEISIARQNGRTVTFEQFSKKEVPELAEAIRGALDATRAGGVDVAELIRQLKALRDEGVLTDGELDRAKERYLGRGPDERQAVVRTLSSLSDLRKAGVLTQVEFDIKKRDILAASK